MGLGESSMRGEGEIWQSSDDIALGRQGKELGFCLESGGGL